MHISTTGRALSRTAIALGAASLLLLSACTAEPGDPGTPGGGGEEDLAAAVEALEPRTLIYASWQQSTNPIVQRLKDMVLDPITEATDGKLTFEVYTDATLVAVPEMVKATGDGVMDFSDALPMFTPQVLPITNFIGTAAFMWGTDWPRSTLLGSMAIREVLSNNPSLQAEYDAVNVVSIGGGGGAPGYPLYCTEELGDPPLTGTLIRTVTQQWTWDIEEALGATAVNLASPEIYEGVQRGVVDCVVLTPPTGNTMGLHEIAGYFYPANMQGFASGGMMFNKDTWNSFAPAIQRLFEERVLEYSLSGVGQTLEDYGLLAEDLTEEFDIQWRDANALNVALDAWHAELAAGELQNRAPEGLDAAGLLADLEAAIDKWNAILEEAGFPAVPADTAEHTRQAWIDYRDFDVDPVIAAIKENL